MARRQQKSIDQSSAAEVVTTNEPQDGDELSVGDEASDEAEVEAERPPAQTEPWKAEFDSFRSEVAALRRENEQLRRSVPPITAVREPEPAADEPDWDKMLFDSPKEALKLFGDGIVQKVKTELTAQYQRDQGAQSFWRDFYVSHPDLREDHDLVQSTLEKNFSDMSALSVPQALEKLALLTRERIVRYSGKTKTSNKRPMVEGAGLQMPAKASEEAPEVTTLGDLIRRNKKRRSGAA